MSYMGVSVREKGEKKTRRKPGRVPTSCAECRRLKLRCDRNVPCEKCVSRGCGSICPDGSLTTGKGNRLVLANTEELHERIEGLCSRIRELEDALRALQSTVSEHPHPLLRLDLLKMKAPQAPSSVPNNPSPLPPPPPNEPLHDLDGVMPKVEEENFIDAFGTLSIGLRGDACFLGKTARSEYLMRAPAKPQPVANIALPRLSERIIDATSPETGMSPDKTLGQEVFSLLPPLSEAIHLCEIYLEYGKYMYTPIPRIELFDEILTVVYRAESFDTFQCHHALSLLFVIFAIASLFDPDRPPYSIEAQEYYTLSRTAWSFAPPVRETTLASIQALMHMAQYLELSDWESLGSNAAWVYIGLATRLGHSVGLHLNSAHWNLSSDTSSRRSRVFWQLFLLDTWLSFSFGRPPSISAAYIDCELPKDTEEVTNEYGQKEIGFQLWFWKYTALMQTIMSTAFVPKLPSYTIILDLDRKIRDFPVPPHLRPNCEPTEQPPPPRGRHMQRWWVLSCKETTLLNLHRSHLAQALHDQPAELLKHKYGPSVLATYRSAWRIIQGLKLAWGKVPELLSRVNLAWSQALSATIVMCLLVTRAPDSNLTASCLEELDTVASLFEEAAPTCRSATSNLDAIQNLRRRAHEAINQSHSADTTTLTSAELDRLSGKTHLFSASSPTTAKSFTPTSRPSSASLSEPTDILVCNGTENMHPTIAQDMRTFDLGAPVFNHIFDSPPDSFSPPIPDIHFPENLYHPQSMGDCQVPYQPPSAGFGSGTPVLDSTWQSFVEQLGF